LVGTGYELEDAMLNSFVVVHYFFLRRFRNAKNRAKKNPTMNPMAELMMTL